MVLNKRIFKNLES